MDDKTDLPAVKQNKQIMKETLPRVGGRANTGGDKYDRMGNYYGEKPRTPDEDDPMMGF